jgi:hypothetical protein
MCIRERLRAVSTVGVARSTFLSLSAWRSTIATLPHRAVPWHQAITKRAGAGKLRIGQNRRAGSHYPTHADSMSKFLSSRSARLFLCFRKQLNIN